MSSLQTRIRQLQHQLAERDLAIVEDRRVRDLLTGILAHLPAAVYQLVRRRDHSYSLEYLSEAITRVAGLLVSDFTTDFAACMRRLHGERLDDFYRQLGEAAERLRPFQGPVQIVDAEGRPKWVWEEVLPVLGPSGDVLLNGIVVDLAGKVRLLASLEQEEAGVQQPVPEAMANGGSRSGPVGYGYVKTEGAEACRARLARLSRRELEVLDLVVAGRSSKQIARILHLSVRTVHVHRMHIMRKLEAGGVADLVRVALRGAGLVHQSVARDDR